MSITRMLALRIHNTTRSCVLMRQYANGVWTLPATEIADVDPFKRIDDTLKQVDGEFEVVSAVCILEQLDKKDNGMGWHSYIYDVRYLGKINPNCPKGCTRYIKGQWMQVEALKRMSTRFNYPTSAFVKAMEKESCLR